VEAIQPGQLKLPQAFKNDPIADCTLGVETAKNNLGIDVLLDVEDIVKYPEQHAMMTYISSFRDYAETSKFRKVSDDEFVPDLNKCLVYGPAFQPGNEAGNETYFTIEVRNSADRKVQCGGHNIAVRITGPHTQSQFSATDNTDGTYFVTFTPHEDGNYIIEVYLNDRAIGESPVHVSIQAVKGPTSTKPVSHWFVLDQMTKKFVPYSDEDNDVLENHFIRWNGGVVSIREFKMDLTKNEEINTVQKYLFQFVTRPIVRGTWFWQDDDAKWYPYDTTTAAILEKAYQRKEFNRNVDISEGKKVRYVSQFPDGSFRQFRQSKEARKEGRPVERGYKGQVIEYELKK